MRTAKKKAINKDKTIELLCILNSERETLLSNKIDFETFQDNLVLSQVVGGWSSCCLFSCLILFKP